MLGFDVRVPKLGNPSGGGDDDDNDDDENRFIKDATVLSTLLDAIS